MSHGAEIYNASAARPSRIPTGSRSVLVFAALLIAASAAGMPPAMSAARIDNAHPHAKAWKLHPLYDFGTNGSNDGSIPMSTLIQDSSGNIYGTTNEGGPVVANCESGCGTVFKLATDRTENVLYSFQGGSDGLYPWAGVVSDKQGNLYGTTRFGGTGNGNTNCANQGCGTIFEVKPDGTEAVLYSFCSQTNCTDGAEPLGAMIFDEKGNLYGTTVAGAPPNNVSCLNGAQFPVCGVVFKLSPPAKKGGKWIETVLHAFEQSDGDGPQGDLLMYNGFLYGTTTNGGPDGGAGTVFSIAPDGKKFAVLYSFCTGNNACPDGSSPFAGVIADTAGNLYGTASVGGANVGCGVVFKLSPPNRKRSVWGESVLHSFQGAPNDGCYPVGDLVADSTGTLYGTASNGGTYNYGSVFSIKPGGSNFKTLYSFTNGTDGTFPLAGLIFDTTGNLYGTTGQGGNFQVCGHGCGTVFELSPPSK
jgi:uncharacterized repeat protein (TIGR03803 family)